MSGYTERSTPAINALEAVRAAEDISPISWPKRMDMLERAWIHDPTCCALLVVRYADKRRRKEEFIKHNQWLAELGLKGITNVERQYFCYGGKMSATPEPESDSWIDYCLVEAVNERDAIILATTNLWYAKDAYNPGDQYRRPWKVEAKTGDGKYVLSSIAGYDV